MKIPILKTPQSNQSLDNNPASTILKAPAGHSHRIPLRSPILNESNSHPPPQSRHPANFSEVPSSNNPTGSAAERNGRKPSDSSNGKDRNRSEASSSEPPSSRRPLPPPAWPPKPVRPPSMKKKDVNPFIMPKRKR